ncbi:MAG: bifunctional methylenetetrahydrofolate dehydrogenase/methenyltetrahydrofolate cyclohydrolase FolD [Anaerolineae bacterium]|nr:bifunctional methylenetetrahydrofolate dehydrogenase/methenyltetrahydrofolate cyclohydrolase FolD [Anaerolineae bacterium]
MEFIPGENMTAQLIDGKAIAQKVQNEVKEKVTARVTAGKSQPGLATVLVGERVDSATYIRMKQKACDNLGMNSFHRPLPEDVSQEELDKLIKELNADKKVNGILIQLPLPDHLDEERALQLVNIEKDVDGFSPINLGRLAQKGREPLFVPCTPYGCIYLLKEVGVEISGANAVVLGRSNIVGMPAALLLIKENATVTVVHSRTKNIPDIVRQADILIAAIGKREFVRGDWIKPGAAVIDVGINEMPDSSKKRGYRLVGDVNFEEAKKVAGHITPVPGGVGPMTIAMLMANTLHAAEIQE